MTAPLATVVQLSDLHLVDGAGTDGLLHGAIDPLAALRGALDAVVAAGVPVAALVLSGDLADAGTEAAYRRLQETVDPVAARLGAEVVPVMGNHDERTAFRRVLIGDGGDRPCDRVHHIGGLRIVALDSTVPGRPDGRLTGDQLAWLRAELATRAPLGTIVVVHHPPVPSPIGAVRAIDLADPAALASVIAGTDVHIVLCGHAHHASAGSLAGVPVWIGPATSYRGDVLPPPGVFRGLTGGAFSRVDVYPTGAVATVVPLGPAAVVHTADERAAVAAMTGAAVAGAAAP